MLLGSDAIAPVTLAVPIADPTPDAGMLDALALGVVLVEAHVILLQWPGGRGRNTDPALDLYRSAPWGGRHGAYNRSWCSTHRCCWSYQRRVASACITARDRWAFSA